METRKININFSKDLFEALKLCKGDETITEFIENAVLERCENIVHQKRGGKVLYISNPQSKAEATPETEKTAMELRKTFLEVDAAATFGTDCGLDELTKFIIERIVTDSASERETFKRASYAESVCGIAWELCGKYRTENKK